MGTKLYTTFLQAGLPAPSMMAATPVACGPDTGGYEYMVGVLRSLLPLLERAGIATAAEVGIETRAARLRDDAVANARVAFLPRAVGVWTKVGGKAAHPDTLGPTVPGSDLQRGGAGVRAASAGASSAPDAPLSRACLH